MRRIYTGPFGPNARTVWTQKAAEMIKNGNGEQFLFILPTAQLLKNVREDLLSSLGGIGTVHLLTFDEIADHIMKELNPDSSLLTPYELHRCCDQLLTKLIHHPLMSEFKEHYQLRGVRTSLMKVIGELKRSGLTVELAQKWINEPQENARTRSLAFFYIEFEKYMEELSGANRYRLLTRESRLDLAAQQLKANSTRISWLRSLRTLWVDHFTDFSPLQFNLLRELIKLPNMKQVGIYLPYLPDYYRNSRYVQPMLEQTIAELQGLQLGLKEGTLTQLCEDWSISQTPQAWTVPTGFTLNTPMRVVNCPSHQQEIQFVCKDIKHQLLNDPGLSLSNIAIITRDLNRLTDTIEGELQKEDLPLQQSQQVNLLDVPLVKQLVALLQVKQMNWHKDPLARLITGSYIRWTDPPTNEVLAWMKRKGIVQGEKGWMDQIDYDLGSIQDESIDDGQSELVLVKEWLQEVKDKLAVFPTTATMHEFFIAAKNWLGSCQIPQTLLHLTKDKRYRRNWIKRDLQAWSILEASIGELQCAAENVGELDRKVSFSTFISEWMELWKEQSVSIISGNDKGVFILEPSAARGLRFKHVYVIGCNEGIFPKTHRENWLLDDSERLMIQQHGAIPSSYHHNEMEQVFFHMTLSLPSESMTLTYTSTETDGGLLPSAFIYSLLGSNPGLKVESDNKIWAHDLTSVSSAHEYQHWLLKEGRNPLTDIHLYRREWLSPSQFSHILDGVHIEYHRHYGAFGEWDGNLKSEAVIRELQALFSAKYRFSVSQINEYISSPLTFFFQRILKVTPGQELSKEVSALDKGNILHEALRRFFSRHRGEIFSAAQLPVYMKELQDDFYGIAKRFAIGTIYENSKLWELEIHRLAKDLADWLKDGLTEQLVDGFFPAFLELSFGLPFADSDQVDPHSQIECIELSLGEESINLYGKIDRIDQDADGHFILYDYKLSLAKYTDYKDLADGTVNYQLPLYLALVKQWFANKGNHAPSLVGGSYYSLRKKDHFKKVGMWAEEKREMLGLSKRTKKGIFASLETQVAEDLAQVERFLQSLRQGDFFLTSRQRPNPYYADNSVYRYDAIAIRHKEKQKGS